MIETVWQNGVILHAQPIGEYDKRLVILTSEMGKITAFARGARRPKSPLLAVSNPFVFAHFGLYEGRDAYTLVQAEAREYFTSLSGCFPGVFYAFYFLELASWYTREGLEAGSVVNLIFVTLRAIVKELIPPELIRRIFELRMLAENGEYAPPGEADCPDPVVRRALAFVCSASMGKLYTFRLTEEQEAEFARRVRSALRFSLGGKEFKSLAVIEEMK